MTLPAKPTPAVPWGLRPIGPIPTLLVGMLALLGPAWLFYDLIGHYHLFSDDFEYVASSRNLGRAVAKFFVPHNSHVVPVWRLLTWAVTATAGSLAALQGALNWAAVSILAATSILLGRLVARETGRATIGLAAMVAAGTTSVMLSAATWYSAGQTLLAGFGTLATLHYLQGWRRRGGTWRLVAAAVAAVLAGGIWTIGHAAGPVGAVYLLADGRRRCLKAAAVPLAATVLAAAVAYFAGIKSLEGARLTTIHGRTLDEAIGPLQGASHMLQAIPENLIFGNLGLLTESTPTQGAVLSAGLALAWAGWLRWARRRPNPLECAGVALVLIAYWWEWSFRAYFPYSSLRGNMPWYDTSPQLGAILFVAGWWTGSSAMRPARSVQLPSRGGALGVLLLEVALIVLHQPRVDAIFIASVPRMNAAEAKVFLIPSLKLQRARVLADLRIAWQARHLARLDQAEAVARREGIGLDAIALAFGRVDAPYLPTYRNAADMLNLPRKGTMDDPERVRNQLGEFFEMEPEPTFPLDRFRSLLPRR